MLQKRGELCTGLSLPGAVGKLAEDNGVELRSEPWDGRRRPWSESISRAEYRQPTFFYFRVFLCFPDVLFALS